jgi:hypothetical protein
MTQCGLQFDYTLGAFSCSVGLSRLAEKQGYIGGRFSLRAIAPETTAQDGYLGGSGLAILEVIAPAGFEKYFVELAEGRFARTSWWS